MCIAIRQVGQNAEHERTQTVNLLRGLQVRPNFKQGLLLHTPVLYDPSLNPQLGVPPPPPLCIVNGMTL